MVVINPFAAPFDEKGRPCTIVQYDPEHASSGTRRMIGCAVERRRLEDKRKRHPHAASSPAQYQRFETTVIYDLSAKPIPHSVYHADLLKAGDLLPADEATAKLAGLLVGANGEAQPFVPPKDALLSALKLRSAEWLLEHPNDTISEIAWGDAGQFPAWVSLPIGSTAKPAPPPINGAESDEAKWIAAEERESAAHAAAQQNASEAQKALKAGLDQGRALAEQIRRIRAARAERERARSNSRGTAPQPASPGGGEA